jgi:xanthine dehydrogenase YagR molybdenum-binding subunit
LMLDRREEHLSVGNRPSSVQTLRIGAKKDGTLTAIHLESYGSGGVGTGSGTSGPAKNLYACPNVLCEEYDVFTNAGPGAAFRAPGHPQGLFALEQAIDELAEKLGVDPLVFRDKIDLVEERGQPRADALARKRERELGAQKIAWAKRGKPGRDQGAIKRGVGFAQGIWYRIVDLDSACEVRVSRDGSVEVLSAVQDIGTGTRTVLAQVVAEELGLRPEQITVRIGDTNYPVGPASGGSRTTGSLTPAARNAAAKVKEKLYAGGATDFKRAVAQMKTEQIAERASREDDYGGTIAPLGGKAKIGMERLGGVQFAEIAVDTETGIINVERIVAVHDAGRVINPLTTKSQIDGGILQGISYALYEQRIIDQKSGHMLNTNFETYKILGAKETPKIEVELIEQYHGRSSTDAGSIGEPATVPTAAAIANAFYNATGVRIRELPMTPARVLKVLEQGGGRA